MKYHHPPAASPYSPPTRALLLDSGNHKQGRSKTRGFIILYFVLKFWDKPLFQKVLKQVLSQWNTTCNENQVLKRVVQSSIGKSIGKGGKNSTLFLVRCLMKAIQVTRVDKIDFLAVPTHIRDWVDENENDGATGKINEGLPPRVIHSQCTHGDANMAAMEEFQRINWNIDRVLKYWFGQFSPEKSQKQLWMVATSSKEHMDKIDAEIEHLFSQLLIELSSTNTEMRETWTNNGESGLYGWKGAMAAIIVLDQMSRHIHRHYTTTGEVNSGLPEQKTLDHFAHDISQEFQRQYADEIACAMIPIPMMIFALMPLRHKSTLQSVGFVQSKVEDIAALHSIDMDNMVRRFRRATNRRMALLQDEARREGKETVYDAAGAEEGIDTQCPKRSEFEEDDIIEFHQFEADMSNASKAQVVKTMIEYLSARGISPSSGDSVPRDTPVIVSLSGGVDSMVIANVLAFLREECGFSQLYIVAVHIDYGNRPESAAEATYVKDYALDILKLDECIVRRIDEVTRGVTKRDEYEKFSRNVRYELYRQTVKECVQVCNKNNPSHQVSEVGVMLGHHRGDVVENVISNSNKGCGPLALSGMTSLSQNDGVTIYRPLLPLEKTDVFDYSHKFGVPYFKDTTPHWSTRGKLRNKLIPLLEEVYGDGCLSHLASLAEESDEARHLLNETALKPFMAKVQRLPMGIIFSTEEFAHQGPYFWKIVLRDMLHSVGLGMFSDKSTETFLKRVLAKKITSGTNMRLFFF